MRLIQDKFLQKTHFSNHNIPVPKFVEFNSIDTKHDFSNENYPFVIKKRTMGYDGYGNMLIKNADDIAVAWEKFNGRSGLLFAEEFIDFDCELAVMVARNTLGDVVVYPCVETIQSNHICHKVIAPARINIELQKQAQDIAKRCVESINGVGIYGVEMFLVGDNILVNEIAPRPHNSGHYTIEGCKCSQYENCIRAILGLPLGSSDMIHSAVVMINLLGKRDGAGTPSDFTGSLRFPNSRLHLYNKKESRVGRKMGHITTFGNDIEAVLREAELCYESFKW